MRPGIPYDWPKITHAHRKCGAVHLHIVPVCCCYQLIHRPLLAKHVGQQNLGVLLKTKSQGDPTETDSIGIVRWPSFINSLFGEPMWCVCNQVTWVVGVSVRVQASLCASVSSSGFEPDISFSSQNVRANRVGTSSFLRRVFMAS